MPLLEQRITLEMANKPNNRESLLLKENILPIEESGQLKFITQNEQITMCFYNIDIFFATSYRKPNDSYYQIQTKNSSWLTYCLVRDIPCPMSWDTILCLC